MGSGADPELQHVTQKRAALIFSAMMSMVITGIMIVTSFAFVTQSDALGACLAAIGAVLCVRRSKELLERAGSTQGG